MPEVSGKSWVAWANLNAKNSSSVDDLAEPFKANVKAFKGALETAGAKVKVSVTKRDAKRAYLFHWSWLIGLKKVKPSAAGIMAGVDIQWDHGDDDKSVAAAQEMISGFGLAVPPKSTNAPALTSKHIQGKAIDMTITWMGDINVKKKDGTLKKVTYMTSANGNSALHDVGASYTVMKLKTDEPHWSDTGN